MNRTPLAALLKTLTPAQIQALVGSENRLTFGETGFVGGIYKADLNEIIDGKVVRTPVKIAVKFSPETMELIAEIKK